MSLPEPPPGDGCHVLQTIWDLTFQSRIWPTFNELDHRWDARHDTDVTDVLRDLPDGLVDGFDRRVPPQPTTRICLTVAGAAICQGAQETLAAFLDFLRVATGVERGWFPPSDDPDASPALTDEEYARQARDLPAAGREPLLQLLFQIIRSEASVWAGLGGPDDAGHWRVSLNRDIRAFRDVTNLDQYWEKRYKSWRPEPERLATAPAAQQLAEDVTHQTVLNSNLGVLSDHLLNRIYVAAGGSLTDIVVVADIRLDVDDCKIEEGVRNLGAYDVIKLFQLDPPPVLPRVQLTNTGADLAKARIENWNSRVFRDRAARNVLLSWLHEYGDSPQGSVPLTNFWRDPRSAVEGHFFTAAELDAAAAYLHDKGLIEGTAFEDHHRGPRWARMTASGIDCLEQGGDVAEYLNPRPSGTTYNFNAPITGTNVAVGDNASQQQTTINGIDAENLATLMRAIVDALPTLDLSLTEQTEAVEAAGKVSAEIVRQQPDHSRLRRGLNKIRGVLTSAGQQSLATVLTATIDYELKKLGLP
jgi:hypothetical protein